MRTRRRKRKKIDIVRRLRLRDLRSRKRQSRQRMTQVAFLFPGQGAQSVGMGRQLVETLPAARRLFDEAEAILGYDLAAVCRAGPLERLNSTAVSQPAIFVTSLAALEALRVSEPAAAESCAATAGLSLGEYTAL